MYQAPPFPTANLPPPSNTMMMGMNDPNLLPPQYPMSTPPPQDPFTHPLNSAAEILQPNDFVSNLNFPLSNFDQMMSNFGPNNTHMGQGVNMGQPIVYLPEELAYYHNLWRYMDPQNQGTVDVSIANEFLKKSGIPASTLFQIENIVLGSPSNTGAFDQNMFCMACRLITHAQRQSPITPETLYQDPPALPYFNMSDSPNASMITDVKPIINTELPYHSTAMIEDNVSNTRESKGYYWTEMIKRLPLNTYDENAYIIPDELQLKYRHLFNLNDLNADGYLEGTEGREFFAHSGLTQNELCLIWKLADVDEDGRLNLNEFAVCVHLVNCRLNDMAIPDTLPPELNKIIKEGLVTNITNKVDKDSKEVKLSPEMKPIKSSDEKLKILNENSKQISDSANAFSKLNLSGVSPSLTTNLLSSDRALSKILGIELNEYENDVTTLRQLREEIEKKLILVKQNIAKQIDIKNKFKKLVENEREQFEQAKSERFMLDLEKIGLTRDTEHYKEELEFLKSQVQDAHSDINYLNNLNTQMDASYNRTEKQIASLHTSRVNITNNLKTERTQLGQDEREITELRDTLQRLQRDKEDAKAHNAVIQERLRQADQDRMILISSIETERQKLLATKDSRIKLAQEKQNLINQLTEQKNELRAQMQTNEYPIHQRPTTTRNTSVSYGQRPRDSKGIPANEPTQRPNIYTTRGAHESNHAENAQQNRWTKFGTSVRSYKDEMPGEDNNDNISLSRFTHKEPEATTFEGKYLSYKPPNKKDVDDEISSTFDHEGLDFNEITEGANDWKSTTPLDNTPNDPFSFK